MEPRAEARSGSRAVERALSVLDCFADCPELTLSEVASRTALPVSTVHRIMQALVRGRFLERNETEVYRVGGHVANLLPRQLVADQVAPHLYALAARIKNAVSFAVLDGTALMTLVCARPPVRHCADQIPAPREPLHATAMGKALLAFNPKASYILSRRSGGLNTYTARTRTSLADVVAELADVRCRGFAISDEERTEGVREVAVPVFHRDRRTAGVIGVQGRSARMTDDLIRSLVPAMRHFASEATRHLGGDDRGPF